MTEARILGVRVDCLGMGATLGRIEQFVDEGGTHLVATVNPEFVMRAQRDREFARVLESAGLCLPDGMGVVWAARRQGCALRETVSGVDLIEPLAAMCARRGFRLFLLGAAPGVAGELAATLRLAHPTLEVASHSGGPEPAQEAETLKLIHEHGSQVLLVAFGAPAQELWIDRLRNRLGVAVAIGVAGRIWCPGAGAVDRPAPQPARGRRGDRSGWGLRLPDRPCSARPRLDAKGRPRMALPTPPPAVAHPTYGRASDLRSQGSQFSQVRSRAVLSIVVPCFNEEQRLPRTIEQIERYLDARNTPYELILVDDGSADGTRLIMDAAAERHSAVRVEGLPHNRGKGRALAVGVEAAKGDEVLITDADLSTPIEELEKLQAALRDGAGVAIGSRALRASRVEISQPVYRVLMGKAFNLIVQAVLLPGIWDTQCGFKLFRADVAHSVFAGLATDGFGFDPEVLYRARKQGVKIAEVPVVWRNSAPTKVSPVRSSLDMLKHVIRLRLRG
ncbi:MAG: WecB/TagA/CpsF family glycosyltransferase [Chloroflexi bacterium]|nr:MAG: WecB/TagA/CpsF family glycosyltransferase [Chloroflexota bacterium]